MLGKLLALLAALVRALESLKHPDCSVAGVLCMHLALHNPCWHSGRGWTDSVAQHGTGLHWLDLIFRSKKG